MLPPGRRGQTRALSAPPCRHLAEGLRAADRQDVFWDPPYEGWAAPAWWQGPVIARWYWDNGLNLPRPAPANPVAAANVLQRHRATVVELLGALHGWRTATTELLISIVGLEHGRHAVKVLTACWRLGIVDVARAPETQRVNFRSPTTMWRPGDPDAFREYVASHVGPGRLHAITGGRDWRAGAPYARHNVLATEVSLRASEVCPAMGAPLGESFGELTRLLHTGGVNDKQDAGARSDAVWLLNDGTWLAVEVTTSIGTTRTLGPGYLEKKIERWARRLHFRKSVPDENGALADVRVVFLLAADPTNPSAHTALQRRVADAIMRATSNFPGVFYDRNVDRIGFVHWSDWFPETGQRSAAFEHLRVLTPPGEPDGDWREADWGTASTLPTTPVVRRSLSSVGHLAQTPGWLRDHPYPNPALTHPAYHPLADLTFRLQPRSQRDRNSGAQRPSNHWSSGHSRPPESLAGIETRGPAPWSVPRRGQPGAH